MVSRGADRAESATERERPEAGLEHQVGTILPGALADLLLVSGDPLDDVADALNIVAVVRNGRFFSMVSLLERAVSIENVE